jgi:hypothetical protein
MLKQLIPDDCASRLSNLVLLIVGIFDSQSVHLSVIARKLPLRAQKLSLAKRLERFVDNPAVQVEKWYPPWASWLIQSASVGGTVHLVIDSTKVTAGHRQIMVGVTYQRRTLPIMWDWVAHACGHCTTSLQIALLRQVQKLIPSGVKVSLVGDGEFNHPLLISAQPAVHLYKRRMWIEAMFGDMKGHGFDLELSRLQTTVRRL